MPLSRVLSGASLAVGLAAFALTGALSLRAHVEPFYAVLRSVGAFAAVLCLTRWSAAALDSIEPTGRLPRGDSPTRPRPAPITRPGRATGSESHYRNARRLDRHSNKKGGGDIRWEKLNDFGSSTSTGDRRMSGAR